MNNAPQSARKAPPPDLLYKSARNLFQILVSNSRREILESERNLYKFSIPSAEAPSYAVRFKSSFRNLKKIFDPMFLKTVRR